MYIPVVIELLVMCYIFHLSCEWFHHTWRLKQDEESRVVKKRDGKKERERRRQLRVGKAPEYTCCSKETDYFVLRGPCLVCSGLLVLLTLPSSAILYRREERERERDKNVRCNFSYCTSIQTASACWASSCLPAYCNQATQFW